MRSIRALVVIAAMLAGPGFATASEVDPSAIATAATPADHRALASQYSQKAAEAREHAKHHTAMGKNYRSDKFKVFAEHCEKLAGLYEAQAKEYEALAAAHAASAKAD